MPNNTEVWQGNKEKHKSKNFLVKFFVENLNKEVLKTIKEIKTNINTVLDIGCGEGFITKQIGEENNDLNITAIDAEKSYIEYAQKNNKLDNIIYAQGDIFSITQDKKYDLIIMTEVLEHIENADTVLKKITELSNRYIIITVPNEPFFRLGNLLALKYIKRLGNTPGHIHNWSKSDLRKKLKNLNLNFEIKTAYFWNIAIIDIQNS